MIEHFEVTLSYKELDKDGGKRFLDTLHIWAITKVKAAEIAKKIWQLHFGKTDLTLLSAAC